MGRRITLFFQTLCFMFVLTACGAASGRDSDVEPLSVVATTGIIADVAQQVAGDHLAIRALIPPDSDLHGFQPTPRDVATISGADLLFVNGLGLETFLQPLLDQADSHAQIIDLSKGITPQGAVHDDADAAHDDADHNDPTATNGEVAAHDDEHEHGEFDPHLWLDPTNVAHWADAIAAALADADPTHADDYRANADRYQAELATLDRWIAAQIETIPVDQRKLVVDHQALSYYAAHYDLVQVGTLVEGISTMAEPSAAALATLQQQMMAEDVRAIFVSHTVNPQVAQSIANDLGLQVIPIYTGSLTPPDGEAPTYLTMMRYNTEAIVEALR